MATRQTKQRKVSFVASEDMLQQLEQVAKDATERNIVEIRSDNSRSEEFRESQTAEACVIRYTAVCADDAVRDFSSLDDLLKYRNPYERRLKRLNISTKTYFSYSVELTLDSSRTISFEYELRGNDEFVITTGDKLDSIISNNKAWFNVVNKIPVGLVGLVGFILLYPSVVALLDEKLDDTSWVTTLFTYSGFLGFVFLLFAALVANIRPYFLPRGQFLIGDGVKRHKKLITIHNIILVVLVVGGLVSVIVNLIS